MRFYKENFGNIEKNQKELKGVLMNPVENVPVAVAAYSDEIFLPSKSELRGKFRNIIQYNYMPNGGHFAAMEDPRRLFEDISQFVTKVEQVKNQEKSSNTGEL